MNAAIDMTGQRFGRLVCIERDIGKGHSRWLCQCDCGARRICLSTNLRRGRTLSCGCLQQENRTIHNGCGTRTYRIWQNMKARCHGSPGELGRRYYRDAGVTVCERWRNSFEAFLEDMGHCPDGLTIDRIENDKGYEPSNCQWASRKEQRLNSSRIHLVSANGQDVCLFYALGRDRTKYRTAMKRIARGMSAQQAYEAS